MHKGKLRQSGCGRTVCLDPKTKKGYRPFSRATQSSQVPGMLTAALSGKRLRAGEMAGPARPSLRRETGDLRCAARQAQCATSERDQEALPGDSAEPTGTVKKGQREQRGTFKRRRQSVTYEPWPVHKRGSQNTHQLTKAACGPGPREGALAAGAGVWGSGPREPRNERKHTEQR